MSISWTRVDCHARGGEPGFQVVEDGHGGEHGALVPGEPVDLDDAAGLDGGQPLVELVVADHRGGIAEVAANEDVGVEQRDQFQAGLDALLALG